MVTATVLLLMMVLMLLVVLLFPFPFFSFSFAGESRGEQQPRPCGRHTPQQRWELDSELLDGAHRWPHDAAAPGPLLASLDANQLPRLLHLSESLSLTPIVFFLVPVTHLAVFVDFWLSLSHATSVSSTFRGWKFCEDLCVRF